MCLHRQQVAAIVRDATPWAVSSAFLHQTSSPDERLNWHTNGKPLMLWLLERICSARTIQAYFNTLYGARRDFLDEKNILSKTEINLSDKMATWQFQFSTIAREFNFIEEDTVSVVIETGEAAELLQQPPPYAPLHPDAVRKPAVQRAGSPL